VSFQRVRDKAARVRSIPLRAVLAATGAAQDRYDKAKWRTAQGPVSIAGMKFMNWARGVGGGGAIDLAMHLNDMGFKDAVEWLWRHFGAPDAPGHAPPGRQPALRMPEPDPGKLRRVMRYLAGDRAIARSILETLIETGKLYADQRANAVFPLLGAGNAPVGAEIRGTGPNPWRGMAPGSRKDLGFFDIHAASAEGIVLCESAIDAISCFALHPWYRCISTAGARPDPRWLSPLIRQGCPVYCGFDADPAGEFMAQALINIHPTVRRLRPPEHDWNDVLRSAT